MKIPFCFSAILLSVSTACAQDGLTIPEEIKRREDRIAKLGQAKQAKQARAKERLIEEQAAYQEKLAARQAKEQSARARITIACA